VRRLRKRKRDDRSARAAPEAPPEGARMNPAPTIGEVATWFAALAFILISGVPAHRLGVVAGRAFKRRFLKPWLVERIAEPQTKKEDSECHNS
jgi:hypothetical protein